MTNTTTLSRSTSTHKLVVTAMLCAVSFIAVLLGRLVPPVAGFLSYDPKDAIIVIAGFLYGPVTSVIIAGIVSLIEMLSSISTTGIIGFLMNVIGSCAFAVPAALLYHRMRTLRGAVLGLAVGMVAATGSMILWNYIVTPFYMGVDRSMVVDMIVPTFLPFNLAKSGINTGIAMVLYNPLVTALEKAHLLHTDSSHSKKTFHLGFTVFALVVLATFVLVFLAMNGVI